LVEEHIYVGRGFATHPGTSNISQCLTSQHVSD